MTERVFTAVVAAADIAEKSFSTFDVNELDIAICRIQDRFFAFENRCSHALANFDNGRLRGFRIMCPLHGATFDVRDGSCTGAPATRPIRTFPVRVVKGMIEVDLSAQD
jgi:3-phenylpropionate/trans-cinnamate dioxygenase ferredoxin subunit